MNPPMYHRIAAAAMALAACGGKASSPATAGPAAPAAPAAALSVAHPRLVPGETITWVVTFAGVEAARARVAVGQVGGNEIVVRAEAQSAGIMTMFKESQEVLTSWIDAETGIPRQSEVYSVDKERTQKILITRADGKAKQVISRAPRGEVAPEAKVRVHDLPSGPVYDNLSAMAILRAWEPKPGERATIWSFGGSRLWRTVLTAEKEEDISTELGTMRARKITGSSTRMTPKAEVDKVPSPAREWTMWISTDERRIPVRIEARLDVGNIVVRVTSFDAAGPND
jgi:hypothetical protein